MAAGAYQVFQAAERLELLASELYLLLAERWADDPDARALFRKLADEEVQHAARVRLLFSQYRNDPKLFEAAAALKPGAMDAAGLVAQTSQLVQDLAAGVWGDDLSDALVRLGDLEEACAGVHAQFLADGAPPAIAQFFEELARQDREHRRLLGSLVRTAAGT